MKNLNLITLSDTSVFDKIKLPMPILGREEKTNQETQEAFVTTWNRSITSDELISLAHKNKIESCIRVGTVPKDPESFFTLKFRQDSIEPEVATSRIKHQIDFAVDLGFRKFIVEIDSVKQSDMKLTYLWVDQIKLSYEKKHSTRDSLIIMVTISGRGRFFENSDGVILKMPTAAKLFYSIGLSDIVAIKSFTNKKIWVYDEIFKPIDAVKALMVGADKVVLSDALAGTDEAIGDLIEVDNNQYKIYSHNDTDDNIDLIRKTGSAQNIFNEYNQALEVVLDMSACASIKELQDLYKEGSQRQF
jgi:hypothetical protein